MNVCEWLIWEVVGRLGWCVEIECVVIVIEFDEKYVWRCVCVGVDCGSCDGECVEYDGGVCEYGIYGGVDVSDLWGDGIYVRDGGVRFDVVVYYARIGCVCVCEDGKWENGWIFVVGDWMVGKIRSVVKGGCVVFGNFVDERVGVVNRWGGEEFVDVLFV